MNVSWLIQCSGVSLIALSLGGCGGAMPLLGGGSGNTVTGGAAGASSSNKNSQLESCKQPLGTMSIFEDRSLPWWNYYRGHYPKLGSTVPVVRTMIQQSNCFVIVERGAAMQAMQRERALMQSGELRNNSNFGKGQLAAADYTLSPSVTFEQSNMGRITSSVTKFLPGSLFSSGSVGAKSNEASTTLLLIDNRSGVQVSSSVGSAKNFDFSFSGYSWGRGAWGGASGYTKTPEGKVIIAAFADSFNQMVKALRHYKPQVVKGGLGSGGALKVDGAVRATPAPTVQKKTRPAPMTVSTHTSSVHVTSHRSTNVSVDAYDPEALNKYYKALKAAVKGLARFAAMTPEQVNAMNQYNTTGVNLWTLMWSPAYSGEMETSKIELESWPLDAKQKGWAILGKRIEKYNKLFYKHRAQILASKGVTKSVRTNLNGVELVTKESLFAE